MILGHSLHDIGTVEKWLYPYFSSQPDHCIKHTDAVNSYN